MPTATTSRVHTPTDGLGRRERAANVHTPALRRDIRAVIVDVDGVLSPVHPDPDKTGPWGDEHVAGDVFGPVLVSRALAQRLDALGRFPGVQCWWLTSWTTEMRAAMTGFPGTRWPVIAEPGNAATEGRGWWKLAAVETWLDQHPEISEVAWCDDHLRGGSPAAVRRRFHARGLPDPLLVAPKTSVGLTPAHFDKLERWAADGVPAAAARVPAAQRPEQIA